MELDAIGREILEASRNELCMNLPFMTSALCALVFSPDSSATVSAATDGITLYYNGSFLAERYLRGSTTTNRLYLHTILHCLLRHPAKKHGRSPELWDLACDAAVESILDSLTCACLAPFSTAAPLRQRFLGECRAELPVLTAEGIYRILLRRDPGEYELAKLQREFLADDHGLWDLQESEDRERSRQQDAQWKKRAEQTQTGMETVSAGEGIGGEAVLEQVRIEARDDIDYRAFLRRFAAVREVLQADYDAFDPICYTYGLQYYGNIPLLEPPETREEKRIEDLVIAIDTSMSTSGDMVKDFLRSTYAILRSTETFTRHLNLHILQCDDQLRSDTLVESMQQLDDYMRNLELRGGSATDYRPVFAHIEALRKKRAFASLRGLLYFTDGMGIYPKARTDYETAFILPAEPPLQYRVPAWCTKVLLPPSALERACGECDFSDESEPAEDMPEL